MDELERIKTALLTVTQNVGHYEAFEKTDQYIVWAEDGESNAEHGSNRKKVQVITGTVDYFTKLETDANVKGIQKAMNDAKIAWRLNSIQYERDTGYIHWEWVFDIPVNPEA